MIEEKNFQLRLHDISFLFVLCLDSIERLENIIGSLNFLIKNFEITIVVLEIAPYKKIETKKLLGKNIQYQFFKDSDSIFHRTRYINQMVLEATTQFISVWDTDVIIAPGQIIQGFELLASVEADFVIPYDKHALDTTPIIRKLFLEDGEIETLEQNRSKMKEMYAPNPLDGAFMANREAYIEAGMENEDFYGWGMEDGERFYRWQRLGYKIKRVPGPLYHLSHGRGINSMFHNPDQGLWKRRETLKAKRLIENGTSYSGSVELIVNGEVVSTQNLTVPAGPQYVQEGYSLVGNTSFDVSGYSSEDIISVEISTSQCKTTEGGTACNIIPNSYNIIVE